MSEIDKVARELLAAEYSKIGNTFRAEDIRNGRVNSDEHLGINAIRTALLAAPPGWKLVPVEPTQEMVASAREHHEGQPYLPASLYRAMLAAAPEVK